ncbi:serine/threonine protein phosphatase 2B catalytic subunit [Trypanosoma rangeli]|uniref:Serine/threonine protein phosphatase 2B catalytic subunit n=1 Tax=Trypanosoma rangeli TaxID=5698 RepID=A0A422N8E0_TRYRA|nr:serine/threonine protein phosphatase 2B catalytic subunit [Trypanosoma rangeli]RNF01711.1 serine/threonine protein phosphatase 2B catalytic subunit [Trypanosoma rangeli]|eukprot:RNF01711.1 serine/threonine protein phosphatase 2B catalytic subunit [Trypanosoma rangeli]
MLRGSHECRHLACNFTLRDECGRKYGETVYETFQQPFDQLPLTALVAESFLCVHGGSLPHITTLSDIGNVARAREPLLLGSMCGLLVGEPHGGRDGADVSRGLVPAQ